MSAYKPGYVYQLENKSGASLISAGSISPEFLENYELLMAEDEVMMTMAGDNIYGLRSTTALRLSLNLETVVTSPDGTAVIEPVISPIPGKDPLWNYVTAMGIVDPALGLTSSNSVDGCGILKDWITSDSKKSTLNWGGTSGITAVSSASFPLFGRNTILATGYDFSGITSAYPSSIRAGSGACNIAQAAGMTGDFTFEQFISMDSSVQNMRLSSHMVILDTGHSGVRVGGHAFRILKSFSGATPIYENPPIPVLPPILTYFHICIERVGKIVTVYLNGVAIGSAVQDVIYAASGIIQVGVRYNGPYRLTQGVARYKGPFTPTTVPFLVG